MARIVDTLAGRFGITALLTNVVLLPVLYLGLNAIVTRSEQAARVTEMRTYGRLVADQLEAAPIALSDEQVRSLLENVLISGDAVYAELQTERQLVRADLGLPGTGHRFTREDFEFGAGDDQVYNLSVPIRRGAEPGILRIGFNERHVIEEIMRTRRLMVLALGAFFAISTLLAIYFGRLLSEPLGDLQRASRRVASGELSVTLETHSSVYEFRRLTDDLEVMRSKLVDVGRRLQEEMRERDVAERHRERLEERLVEQRRLETVGTLAGGIAHEFNNILVPIQLYTELAMEGLEPQSEARADLQRVLDAARRAKRIVNDILVFTRTPAPGKADGVDVVAVATEVARLQERLVPPNVHVVLDVDTDCPRVRGDAAMLQQVIANLCSNACQAMAEHGGALRIRVARAAARALAPTNLPMDSYVDVCVGDGGHGIDASVRPHIFEPFFTTRAVGHGTGLGLFVVHGMVTSMGGIVTVESEPGVGTEFHVLLRVQEAEDSIDPRRSETEEVT